MPTKMMDSCGSHVKLRVRGCSLALGVRCTGWCWRVYGSVRGGAVCWHLVAHGKEP
ncbi:hypothetical protein ERO13_A13G205501v2 [Gossypium hirsutum]|nr:hypothetical protein ERO13_A13G205501v2 [Gossypium hirsutum]